MPSLLEALELKYGSSSTDCFLTDENIESGSPKTVLPVSIFIPKKSPRHTVPALLVLQDCDIDSAGEDDEKLRNKCKNVEELDLAQNKILQWNEVFGILQYMPKIKFLNLSFNNLESALEVTPGHYDYLKNLVLNGTRVSWPTVQLLNKLLKNLEELHLSRNEYKSVDIDYQNPESKHLYLKKLHLTGNPIEYWSEIIKLGYVFPNLESLVLAECPIRSLDHNKCICSFFDPSIQKESLLDNSEYEFDINQSLGQSRKSDILENTFVKNKVHDKIESDIHCCNREDKVSYGFFKMLKFLNVNGTLLSTWNAVEKLAKFPALKSLRIQSCPLFEVRNPSQFLKLFYVISSSYFLNKTLYIAILLNIFCF